MPFLVFSPTDVLSGTVLRHLTARIFSVMLNREEIRGAPLATGGKSLSSCLTDEL